MKATLIRIITPLTLISCVSAGCSRPNYSPRPTIDPKVQEQLEAPINCATAKEDIASLEDARASVAKQVISGVRAVNPFSAAAGVVLGDEQDRLYRRNYFAHRSKVRHNERLDLQLLCR